MAKKKGRQCARRVVGAVVVLLLALLAPIRPLLALLAMSLFPSNVTVQSSGCLTVARFVYDNHLGKQVLYHFGGLVPPMNALRRFPDDKLVQLSCAHAIGGMSLFEYATMHTAGDRGAVELVVEINRKWPDDPEMQIGGVHGCFMDYSSVNRARWAKAGGMEVNMAAIRNHYQNASVQFPSWCAFSSGTNSPNEEKFAELGGFELAVQVMHDHPTSYRVREEVMQSVRAPAIKAAHLRERLAEAGYIEAAVLAMKDAPLDMHQQSPACASMAILAFHSEAHRDRCVVAGAVKVALAAVRDFHKMTSPVQWQYDSQYTVYTDCLGLLSSLANNTAAIKELGDSDAAAVISSAMQRGGEANKELQLLGRDLLKRLQGAA